jgi:hypothetical protein
VIPCSPTSSSLESLSLDRLDEEAAAYDAAVRATPDIDRFCSSSAWILPAARYLHPGGRPFVNRQRANWIAFMRVRWRGLELLRPLEAMWGFPAPVLGEEPAAAAEMLLQALVADRSWDVCLIGGLAEGSALEHRLRSAAAGYFRIGPGPMTRRHVADLRGGIAAYLGRRSPELRRSLRKAARRARDRGVIFEVADATDADAADELFERLLAIERRCWKSQAGAGIDSEPMCSFYRDINRRLARSERHRLLFARLDGEDVAYVLGATFAGGYRGLQFSFDQRFAHLSLGNLCQLEEITRLCVEGFVSYDLGMEVPYKRRFGESLFVTRSLILHR